MIVQEGENRAGGCDAAVVALHEIGQVGGDAGKARLEAALVGEGIAQRGLIRLDVRREPQHLIDGVDLNQPRARQLFTASRAP